MLVASGALRGLGERLGWAVDASGGDIWGQMNGYARAQSCGGSFDGGLTCSEGDDAFLGGLFDG